MLISKMQVIHSCGHTSIVQSDPKYIHSQAAKSSRKPCAFCRAENSAKFGQKRAEMLKLLPTGSVLLLMKEKDGGWKGCINPGRSSELRLKNKRILDLISELVDQFIETGGHLPLGISQGDH